MRIKLVIFCMFAVLIPIAQIGKPHLTWLGWLLVSTLIGGAAGFVALLMWATPSRTSVRTIAYCCAVVATQGYGIASAIVAVLSPDSSGMPPPAPTAKDVILGVAAGAFSVWAFFLVRTWVSRGIREYIPRKHDSRSRIARYSAAAAAVAIVLSGPQAASGFQDVFLALTGAAVNPDMHTKAGVTADWLAVSADTSVAGLREEPIYVGIAVLLFPAAYRSPKAFAIVAAGTSIARTLLHVYYASGQEHTALGIGSIFLWCTIWSTVNLGVFYWTKNLVPIIVGHGISNIFVTNASGDWEMTGTLAEVVKAAESAAIVSILIGVLIYMFMESRRTFSQWREQRKAQVPAG